MIQSAEQELEKQDKGSWTKQKAAGHLVSLAGQALNHASLALDEAGPQYSQLSVYIDQLAVTIGDVGGGMAGGYQAS